jgi:endoglucanase
MKLRRLNRVIGQLCAFVALFGMGCVGHQPFVGHKALLAQQPVSSRFLHQRGAQIVGPDGRRRILHGVNLGGWLHWEAWIFGADLNLFRLDRGSESQLLGRIEELYGGAARQRFLRAIHERFITDADLKAIAARGFDSVRLPINHTLLESEAGWQRLKDVVRAIGSAGLGVILNMHAAPGGQSKFFIADPDDTLLWDDPAAQAALVAMWSRMAKTFKDEPMVFGYDVLNEPDVKDSKKLLALYGRIIAAIRRYDREHLIFIEGATFSRDFNIFTRRLDDNMAYSPHVYLWIGSPDQTWLARLEKLAKLHDTPVWIGEFGEDRLQDIRRLREGFERLSGWAVWTWKKVDRGGTPGVMLIDAPKRWLELIKSLNSKPGTKAVMTKAEAFAALDAFLAAAARARPQKGMQEALGR